MNHFFKPSYSHQAYIRAADTQNIYDILTPHLFFLKTKIPNEDTNKSI